MNETNVDLSEPRFVGTWICFPVRIEGNSMVYLPVGCYQDEIMPLDTWLRLTVYRVRECC